jgi:hypothetical protein
MCIYQLLFTLGPKVLPSFYYSKKGGGKGANCISLVSHCIVHYNTKLLMLAEVHG